MLSLLLGFCHSEKVASLQGKLRMGMLRKIHGHRSGWFGLLTARRKYLKLEICCVFDSISSQKQQKDRQQ